VSDSATQLTEGGSCPPLPPLISGADTMNAGANDSRCLDASRSIGNYSCRHGQGTRATHGSPAVLGLPSWCGIIDCAGLNRRMRPISHVPPHEPVSQSIETIVSCSAASC
jgi:hypothetical protein